jgi:hypothetical protein
MNKIAYINADIWTMESPLQRAEALIIENGLIKKVGSTEEIVEIALADMNFEVVDLSGKTILPGFIDSHIHLESNALAMLQVDLKYPKVENIRDILDELSKIAKNKDNELEMKNANDTWVVGNLYDHNKLTEKRHPNKIDLDSVSTNQPILIFHISGHMVAVNSKALEISGITKDTPDPAGGKIERDDLGEPTGVLFETAFNLVVNNIPPYSKIEKSEAITKSINMLLEKGITGVHDMGVEDYTVDIELYFQMFDKKQLKTRINILYPYASPEKAEEDINDADSLFNKYLRTKNDFIKLAGLKCFSDGSMVGRTAAVKKPYKDKSGNGMMLLNNDQLLKMARLAYSNKLQLGIHAIGDRAIENCLDAYEEALAENAEDYRFRIEHCGIGSDDSFKRMEKMNIIIASQPQFLYDFGDGILDNYDEDVLENIYEFKSMLENNLHLSFGSDGPVTFPDPLSAISCAIDRKTQEGRDFVSKENISLYDAVKAHTLEGAYASFEEDKKGMIKEGYFADIVILSEKLSIESLKNIKVEQTILNGKIEFTLN